MRAGSLGHTCNDGPMPPTPRFLTLADVAEVLSTSSAQVYALVRRGDLPAIKIGGRGQWRVEATQLEAYIERMYDEARTFVDAHPFTEGDAEGRATRRVTSRPGSADLEPRVIRTLICDRPRSTVNGMRVARLVGADRHDQRDPVGDLLAVHLGDHVALPQTRLARPGCRR